MTQHVDASKIENRRARHLLWDVRLRGGTNREFYRCLPPEKLDWQVQGDSPRDSLLYQLYVTRNYVHAVRGGALHWGPQREVLLTPPALHTYDKRRLLVELERADLDLALLLSDPAVESRYVCLPWSRRALPALEVLASLIDHEVLQTSCNLALMRALGVEIRGLSAAGASVVA